MIIQLEDKVFVVGQGITNGIYMCAFPLKSREKKKYTNKI